MAKRPMTLRPEHKAELRWVRAARPGIVFELESEAGIHAELDVRSDSLSVAKFLGSDGAVKRTWQLTKDIGFFGGAVEIKPDNGAALKASVGAFGGADLKLPEGGIVAWERAANGKVRQWKAEGGAPILTLDIAGIRTKPSALTIADAAHPQLGLLIVLGWFLAYCDEAAKSPPTIAGVPAAALTAATAAALVGGTAIAAAAAAPAVEEAKRQSGLTAGDAVDAVDVADAAGSIVGALFSLFD